MFLLIFCLTYWLPFPSWFSFIYPWNLNNNKFLNSRIFWWESWLLCCLSVFCPEAFGRWISRRFAESSTEKIEKYFYIFSEEYIGKLLSTQNGRGLWRENYAISWIQSPSHKHKPHQSHGLAMDKQSEQGNEPEKKKSNGQTSQIQQTDERGQHGSWQTRAQKENMEQKQDRDQLSPLPRSDSKWWLSEGKLSKGSSPATTKFPAQLAYAEPHGPAKCEWAHMPPGAEYFHGWHQQQCQGAFSCGLWTPAQPSPHPATPKTSNRAPDIFLQWN